MKEANTGTARWYLCECDRKSCREEFYMTRKEYTRATLGAGRLVVPDHRPRNAKVLARWNGVVMVEKKGRENGRDGQNDS